MLHGEEGRNLVVPKDDFALWIEDESHVEEPIFPVGMVSLGLPHDKGVVFTRDGAERIGFRAGNIDCTFARVLNVVQVQYLVGKALQGSLWQSNQTDRQFKAGKPRRRLHHVSYMFEVDRNIVALSYSTDCGD